ncbi:MAG TPA: 50S ribosomal protein L11 methyltransferase [Candidatus Nitrosotalea sp.]|nr:50S ribosomal protein L11 methyltransferase [Candidatus Nitrosotalea sp.]
MPFWQLTVPASAETSDGLTNFLWEQGALGVVEEELPGHLPRLRAFFPESASSTALRAAVHAYQASLRVLGFPVEPESADIAPLLDEAWASAWQQSFPAREVGQRILIMPPWLDTPGPDGSHTESRRLTVVIEPGRAFGTGHHGTTEGCLVLLEEALAAAPGSAVLDIGTGTGILAIAALRLGAPGALAIDVDSDAVSAAQVNAARNGCTGLSVRLAEPQDVRERFPLVLANLLAHTHLALAPHYARLVAPAGHLVLGGMLDGEDARVAEALSGAGFTARSRVPLEGWASLLLVAPPR